MYKQYWGFKEKPFENTPDPRFMYYSIQHLEALTRLLFAVTERKGAAILTGEYGSGKTFISRVITSRLLKEEHNYNIALIVNPAVPSLELLQEILFQLGEESKKESRKIDVLRALNERLYKNMNENRHTVVIIDEAQVINSTSVFEEIRLLLNFQSDDRFLLTLLLLGQPDLKQKVGEIPQLEQRFSVKYHLTNLNLPETVNYIMHRCQAAGRKENIFTDRAYRVIYEASKGIPRKINNICDISLLVGHSNQLKIIDEGVISAVAEDLKEYLRPSEIPQQEAERAELGDRTQDAINV